MPRQDFTAEVKATDGGSTMALAGTVDRAAKEGMEEAYAQAVAIGGDVTMNFTAVDYINSTGIAVIVGLLAKARAEGRDVTAYGLTDHYREVFRITRLSDFMTIQENALT